MVATVTFVGKITVTMSPHHYSRCVNVIVAIIMTVIHTTIVIVTKNTIATVTMIAITTATENVTNDHVRRGGRCINADEVPFLKKLCFRVFST